MIITPSLTQAPPVVSSVRQPQGVAVSSTTLAILGGGQLGRYLAMTAKRLGHTVCVWSDTPEAPALSVADIAVVAPYHDTDALQQVSYCCTHAMVEFENLPYTLLEHLEAAGLKVRPHAKVLALAQHRVLERRYLRQLGVAMPTWFEITTPSDLETALAQLHQQGHGRSVLKTSLGGYDGKGQVVLATDATCDERQQAWQQVGTVCLPSAAAGSSDPLPPLVLEAFVPFVRELSLLVARNPQGQVTHFPLIENEHQHQRLVASWLPVRCVSSSNTHAPTTRQADLTHQATALATRLAEGLGLEGLLCVELFETPEGELWVNELAPRPHNSGHLTIEATPMCQYELALRCLLDLPLPPPEALHPHTSIQLINIYGDCWQNGDAEAQRQFAHFQQAHPLARLHLYGKKVAKAGRKMGHWSLPY